MTLAFTLLPATAEHYDAVFALHESLFRSHIEQIWGWHPDWQQQNFRSNWSICDTKLIEVEGRIAGYLQTLLEADHLFLKNLGLLPLYQRRGIGTELIQNLQSQAKESRLPIWLSVFATNSQAERFYECMGFAREDRTDEFQHMRWTAAT